MSLPFEPPPPPPSVYVGAYRPHGGYGSVGPVIAVLAVIAVLGLVAGVVGRLCTGGTIMGYGQYDLEGWVERRFTSCIDGRLEASPPPPPPLTPHLIANGAGWREAVLEMPASKMKHADWPPEGPAES